MGKRRELEKRDGTRFRCRAVVDRFGSRSAFRGPPVQTVLLRDVVDADAGVMLADHLWFPIGKWSSGLAAGDIFEIKVYQGRRDVFDAPVSRDWKLQRPTKVTLLSREGVAV